MSIGKSTMSLVVLLAAVGRAGAAQTLNLEDKTPLVVSGFAVGLGSYDRNLAQNTALGSNIALSAVAVACRTPAIDKQNLAADRVADEAFRRLRRRGHTLFAGGVRYRRRGNLAGR